MAEVINLFAKKEEVEETPHITAPARCMQCKHEWQVVAEIATDVNVLECPSCTAHKGFLTKYVYFNNVPIYSCVACAGVLWTIIVHNGVSTSCCANCGMLIELIKAFDQATDV